MVALRSIGTPQPKTSRCYKSSRMTVRMRKKRMITVRMMMTRRMRRSKRNSKTLRTIQTKMKMCMEGTGLQRPVRKRMGTKKMMRSLVLMRTLTELRLGSREVALMGSRPWTGGNSRGRRRLSFINITVATSTLSAVLTLCTNYTSN